MVSFKSIKNIVSIPELTRKLLFTIAVLIVYSIGKFLPVIGVNVPLLVEHMKGMTGALGGFLRYVDLFSGGALQQCTLFALGVGPYITASIMMQILSMSVPYFEQLSKEGDYGRKQINQYTRYLALGLSIIYGIVYSTYIDHYQLFLNPGFGAKFIFVLSLTVGSMFTMWLGEQISLMGLGSGSSLIIFTGIVARFPDYVAKTVEWVRVGNMHPLVALFILVFFIAVTACIVFLEKGDRKIPVQYARRVIGQRVYGGQNTYIPFKINNVGVMPIIFASSMLNLPYFLFSLLAQRFESFKWILDLFQVNGFLYNVLEFFLILFFTFLYLTLIYNPVELANDMKKQGGFVPGIRPGKQTADYFDYILTRIGLIGAFYLAMLALLPNIVHAIVPMPFFLQGTSLLISVGVALEISSLIESYLLEHNYGGFLKTGKLKSGALR